MANPRENPALLAEDGIAPAETSRLAKKPHDEGSDANDTVDGLTESEESVRHAAEDIPAGQDPAGSPDATPVFDRGSLPPKV
jgi:hypothetical protein